MIGWLRVFTIVVLMVFPTVATANPIIKENWHTYRVDGLSANMLHQQMRNLGPDGFWAYTRWYVRWTSGCEVSLTIDYTMPKHINRDGLPDNLRAQWDRMVTALRDHEIQHGSHGVSAAKELVRKGCRNGDAIIDKWAAQDKILDQRTDHGRSEGVALPRR